MSNEAINKREKSLGEIVLVVLLFSILMATFIHYFFKSETQINQVGFANLANNFSSQIILIHSKWLMDGKPVQVKVTENNLLKSRKKIKFISVNKKGWVNSKALNLSCTDIWQNVMSMPMFYAKKPVSAVQLQRHVDVNKKTLNEQQQIICRFSIESGQFFEYYSKNGKVISAK